MRRARIDRPLVFLLAMLLVGGALIFSSAAFGLFGRGATNITSVVFNHLALGIGLGLVMLTITANLDYRLWRRYALYIFGAAIIITLLVFVPHIGVAHGGGRRWIHLLHFSFQPSELLKLASIIIAGAYCAAMKDKIKTSYYGLGGFVAIAAIPAIIMLLQPDLGTLGVIGIATLSVFWAAGTRLRDILALALIALIALALLVTFRPYVRDRVETFFHPTQDQQQEGYQIRQSLIAIGSGGVFGRGFGQGIQKFTYLPEPMGDSIFAVAGEELGFAGAVSLITIFTLFALRGFHIATRVADPFGKYVAIGISTYLVIEAFINIASMLGVAPLTGIPLTFVSQGGSAMLMSLVSAGILLNISRVHAHKHG